MYLKLFGTFMKIGVLGFGGGLAIVQLIYDSVQPFMNMARETFANIVAISQITPGPLGINVATFVGHEYGGILGAIIATLGVALPAFIIMNIVCRMLKKFRGSLVVEGALDGIRPATIGLICAAAVTLTVPAIAGETRLASGLLEILSGMPIDMVAILIVVLTVVLIGKFKKSPIFVLLIMGCLGAVIGV